MGAAQWWERLRSGWRALSPNQRRLWGVAGGALGVLVALLVAFASYTPYTTVYTGLSPATAGQIAQALQSMKVPYRLLDGGTAVAVPQSQADQVRVTLAMQNLPQQGQVGYQNVLNASGLGMTDQQFNLAVLNALEQDLASTISTMEGVRAAAVQIVEPPQSAFALPPQGGARASVYVQLQPGAQLSAQEVNGIVQLVSHSVPGLSPSAVAVVDQYGQLLSTTAAQANPGSSASAELEVESQVENTLAQRITALLEPVVGPGNVAVTVHANLSFQQSRTTSQVTTSPRGGIPTQSTVTTETYQGTGTPPALPAGVSGNAVPTYPAAAGTAGRSTYRYQQRSVSYAISRVVTQTVGQPMTVTGITVSLFVNARAYPLTAARTAQLQNLVATAIGLPAGSAAARRDITVAAAPFAAVPIPSVPAPRTLPPWMEMAAAGVLVVGLGLLLVFTLRRRPATVPQPAMAGASIVVERTASQVAAEEEQRRERELLESVVKEAQRNPEDVANLLRGWLREDGS